MKQNNILINSEHLDIAQKRLRALAHLLRLRIINYIHQNPNCFVKHIYKNLGIEQSVTSQHLKILRDADIVINNRMGKNVSYTLNYSVIKKTIKHIEDFL